MPAILLIEDDPEIADKIASELTDRCYEVTWAATGSRARRRRAAVTTT